MGGKGTGQWFVLLRRSTGLGAPRAPLSQERLATRNSPVQPGQQGLGRAYELHHRSQELVGGLVGRVPVISWALPPAAYVIL